MDYIGGKQQITTNPRTLWKIVSERMLGWNQNQLCWEFPNATKPYETIPKMSNTFRTMCYGQLSVIQWFTTPNSYAGRSETDQRFRLRHVANINL